MEASSTDRRPRSPGHARTVTIGLGLVAAHLLMPARADLTAVPNLTPPELEAARAAQAIYDALREQGEQQENGLPPDQQAMFDKLEELVHTANEQQERDEPTDRTLGVDEEGLAFALDWVANSEASSGSGVSMNAVHTQFAQAVRRIATLQAGGLGIARAPRQPSEDDGILGIVRRDAPHGGASADLVTPWGAFANVSYGRIDHDRTALENEFAVDHYGVTLGVDYRVHDTSVVGAALGYARADLDFAEKGGFDGGGMDAGSYSMSLYGLHDQGDFYINGIVTLGRVDFDLTRNITYASENPAVDDTDETALSSTDGRQFLVGLATGYQFDLRPTTITPSARFDLLSVKIDGYREANAGPFNLEVDSQTIRSARSTLGVDATRPVPTGFGVLIPRLSLEWHHEFRDPNPEVGSRFVADPAGTTFVSPGDDTDSDFFTLSGSVTAVVPRGVQAFAEVQTVLGLRDTSAYNLTAGVRSEF